MSTAGTPAARNGRWSSSTSSDSSRNSRRPSLRAADQIASVSHAVDWLSRLKAGSFSPIMSTRIIALICAQRPGATRGRDVVPAAVGIAGFPFADRLFAVEEEQLDRHRVGAPLQHAGQLDEKRGAGSGIVCADEVELFEELGVVVAGDDQATRTGPRNRDAHVGHSHDACRRLCIERLLGHLGAELRHLLPDVVACLLRAGGSRRTRANRHDVLQMLERASRRRTPAQREAPASAPTHTRTRAVRSDQRE